MTGIRVSTMSSGKPKQGDTRLVVAATTASALMEAKKADHGGSSSIVEYKPPVMLEDEEDLEVKLRRILENVPVRVSNTSGSSAGSGSGDFHQVTKLSLSLKSIRLCIWNLKLQIRLCILLLGVVRCGNQLREVHCWDLNYLSGLCVDIVFLVL